MSQRFGCRAGFAAVAMSAVLLVRCSGAGPDQVRRPVLAAVPYPPPPNRAEIPPAAPSVDALWRGGHWTWTASKYVWEPGSYIQRPLPTANWIPGYWAQGAAGWIWTEGRWQY